MAYDNTKPLDTGYLADAPAELRANFKGIIEDKIVNAAKLNDLEAGNTSGSIPISNGTLNVNLNSDMLDGFNASDFAAASHEHDGATSSAAGFMTAAQVQKLEGIATGAEVNQNAFAKFTVGDATISADSKSDTLTFQAGAGINLTADPETDTVTVTVGSHTHDYLPLSGGTMTGTVFTTTPYIIRVPKNDGFININGDTDNGGGGYIQVFGRSHSTNPGEIKLIANTTNSEKNLRLSPDGRMTWNGNNVITSAGGTLNGKLYFSNDAVIGSTANSGVTRIDGGTDYSDGAFLALHGINWKTSANAGAFQLEARDSSGNTKTLWGYPNGLLAWPGTFQLPYLVLTNPLSIRRNVNTSYTSVYGGTGPNDGARLMLAGSGDSDHGKFRLFATKSSTESVPLEGSPDGNLKWGGCPVAFFTTTNLSSKYFRFNNGIQVCWGLGYYETNATVTYPIAFAENPGIACNSIVRNPTNWSTTGFKMEGNASYAAWIAVGRWA